MCFKYVLKKHRWLVFVFYGKRTLPENTVLSGAPLVKDTQIVAKLIDPPAKVSSFPFHFLPRYLKYFQNNAIT